MFNRLALFVVGLALVALACAGGGDSGDDPIRAGRTIYGNVCSVCHGSTGGGGVGPAFDEVTSTWPECSDHIEWVSLGSDGWKASHGDTYGATGKPVKGGMPSHKDSLTLDEIRRVAAFERIQYGGAERAATLAACGLSAEAA